MNSQKVIKFRFPSFRRKPESSLFKELQTIWTPVFTGVTTSCEFIKVDVWEPDIKELFDKYPDVAQYPSHWQHDLILPYQNFPTYSNLVQSGKLNILNYKDRPNVVGTWKGLGGGGRSLILNGHIDTVTIEPRDEWTHDPFGAEIEDGRMYGRGTSDMKSGIIAAMVALESLIELGVKLRGDVVFESVVNEEHAGNGTL